MNIRAQAVEQARAEGLCTQCLKNKAAPHRFQCQRCIDTNKRKWERRMTLSPEERRKRETDKKQRQRAKKRELRLNKGKRVLSEEHIQKIRDGVRRAKAEREGRKKAFGAKDTEYIAKRKYTRRAPIASVQMAGAVADLERFIGNLSTMSATDYLEAREELIRSIIRRGGANGNS